jgi:hypothetical protein
VVIPNVSQIDFSPLHMRAELVCAPWLNWRIELGEWRHFGTSACGTGVRVAVVAYKRDNRYVSDQRISAQCLTNGKCPFWIHEA